MEAYWQWLKEQPVTETHSRHSLHFILSISKKILYVSFFNEIQNKGVYSFFMGDELFPVRVGGNWNRLIYQAGFSVLEQYEEDGKKVIILRELLSWLTVYHSTNVN